MGLANYFCRKGFKKISNMGMEVSEETKTNGERTEKGYSVFQIILGLVMLIVGVKYLPSSSSSSPSSSGYEADLRSANKDSDHDPCKNGVAYYLYVAGTIILVTNMVSLLTKFSKYMAEKDGRVTCGEKCGLTILSVASTILVIADLAILIWGSVLVFSRWPHWISNYEKYDSDPEKYNYCRRTPMLTAFVVLIIKWVSIPLFVAIVCCCTCLCSCCALGLGLLGIKAARDHNNQDQEGQ